MMQTLKIQFNETNLIQSELASLHHKGLDLSTCQIQGAMFDLASLKGLIINDFQAVDLIGILGVKSKIKMLSFGNIFMLYKQVIILKYFLQLEDVFFPYHD